VEDCGEEEVECDKADKEYAESAGAREWEPGLREW